MKKKLKWEKKQALYQSIKDKKKADKIKYEESLIKMEKPKPPSNLQRLKNWLFPFSTP